MASCPSLLERMAPAALREARPEAAAASIPFDATPRGVRRGLEAAVTPAAWRLATFLGRLGEISSTAAGAALTLVFRLVLDAQERGEPAVWVARPDSVFYPPDAAAAGIDLTALPVVRAPDDRRAARAADFLLRSGAFGLVVLDLGPRAWLPLAAQTRLSGLAQKHDAALVCITEKSDRSSLGSLVSIRAETAREARTGDRFRCRAWIVKDKRRGPGWEHEEVCRGPDGLC